MAKPVAKQTSSAQIVIIDGVINGRKFSGINYRRIQRADGTIEETGRPPGLPENATVSDIIRTAFSAATDTRPAKRITGKVKRK